MSEDISPEVIKKTQKLLGKYVKKPPLTEKLLKKPPFRFLHDVVITIIKDTGFLKGLYSEGELKSENVKEKDSKIAFLNKLIDAVNDKGKISSKSKITNNESTPKGAKGRKSINESPRSKAKASTPKDSSRTKNRGDKSNVKNENKFKTIAKEERVEINDADINENKVAEVTLLKETVKNADVINSNDPIQNVTNNTINAEVNNITDAEGNTDKVSETPKDSFKPDIETKEGKNGSVENVQTSESSKSIVQSLPRPKSARPKSGDKIIVSAKQRTATVDSSEERKPLEMIVNQPPQRPKSSLRPPSVRPSSARPGAPRLRPDSALPLQETVTMGGINVIVENVDNADDEETVVIQTTSEVTEDNLSPVDVPQDNKGHLVEQILEQIQEEGENVKKKVDIDWESDGHLEQLQEEIKKQQQEIINVRSNILRNELRIKELLNV
ncbi:hypothetical protein NQ314_013347 [Rhamnusium bicolor]|uniref:TRAF3-interacting protein 1 N-terminal domain-containing protein n=1 Tax=Rhamnusium bicolor TaxID=1586634 RepID=A0AAV8X6Q2_9CUCU|nr:hypothetical protein NQ314_013347 [Rhamnusium bicolor]